MTRTDAIAAARALSETRFLEQLAERVAVKTESQNPARRSDCLDYLRVVARDLERDLGCTGEVFANPDSAGGPILVARRIEDPALPTVLIYGHGDVVLGMEGRWAEDRDPWATTRVGDRLYGRGTADNKGQHTLNFLALETVLRVRGSLGFNVTVLLESSEETGSAGLHAFCEAHKELLASDLLIASDGPRLSEDVPTIVGGTRGVFDFDLVCNLREGAHHSGNWGGLLANPAVILSHAIASLISATGRIAVRELVPERVPESVRRALAEVDLEGAARVPPIDAWWGEPGITPAERVFAWSTLDVLAFTAGNSGKPMNAIPPEARARCHIRYTVDANPAVFATAIRQHLAAAGLGAVEVIPVHAGPTWKATRLDPEHPAARWAAASIADTLGRRPTMLPNGGGSLPNDCFSDILGLPTIWVPHSYPGCSQHAPDEHILMKHVDEGFAVMAGLFWDLGTDASFLQRKV